MTELSITYEDNVFINCPFDDAYHSMMEAIVFVVHDCGFVARSALEIRDSSRVRISTITSIIENCQLGIHDISRTSLDEVSQLPRFNMPLELGVFLGAKRFGDSKQRNKMCLVLDTDRYRYQQFCSDIAGQDIAAHGGEPDRVIGVVRNWLRSARRASGVVMPGAERMIERYREFLRDLPVMCAELQLTRERLIWNDFTTLVVAWLEENEW